MSTRTQRLAASVAVLGASVLFAVAPAQAHDDIVGSDPESGTVVDDPITEVTIEFGVPVNDVEMALFGPGDDNLIEDTTTTILSPTSAKIEFAPVEEEGMYIVRYLTTATVDQHLLVGAVSFTYGSAGGSGASGLNWLLFAIPMIIILAIGTAWSYRLHRRQTAAQSGNGSEVDEDLSDVGI
jgi:methionine-rich copper-binding protein CopC